tara:strand:- start:402 stop:647 length:246 start_codon:yes stop_codon:yes gene_type:complete
MFILKMSSNMKIKFVFMDQANHDKEVIEVCKTSIGYIKERQKNLTRDNLLREHKAISEEFKEWLIKEIPKQNIVYLINMKK